MIVSATNNVFYMPWRLLDERQDRITEWAGAQQAVGRSHFQYHTSPSGVTIRASVVGDELLADADAYLCTNCHGHLNDADGDTHPGCSLMEHD